MLPLHSILWPSDASESSIRALQAAVELAKQHEARLFGLQVVPQVPIYSDAAVPLTTFDVPRYEEELKTAAQKQLQKTMADLVPEGIKAESAVEIGKPSDIILTFAMERKVDLIVMASHARTGLSHFLIGSVTEDTIRRSTIPVLVIPDATGSR